MLLEIDNLGKTYNLPSRSVQALRSLTFGVERGELVCLVGPSGCGKTTLLRCVAGLLNATHGTVTLDGERVHAPPRGMAMVFQEYGRSLMPWLTIRDNVALPLRSKLDKAARAKAVEEALTAVGLGDVHTAYPWQLSGGMQQRVAIARALAYGPDVLLMDEPVAAVDAQTRAELEDLILRIWRQLGVTTMFVTHDIDEAVYLGQRVIVLSSSPTVVQEILRIDLPADRDQLTTRADPRFTELRTHIYAEIQQAKKGDRVAAGLGDTARDR